ncbi:MAG: TlpA family protein disulfide reductase [Proteobacteria bacterium]|nr:TlpA family protein disulfide reductase [Pseudomonadota bacterium]
MTRPGRKALLAAAVALSVLALTSIFAIRSGRQEAPPSPPIAGTVQNFEVAVPPRAMPEVGMRDAAGAEVGLGRFRGKVVLLNLWATWCGPCVREMPSLDRLQAALAGERFEVVALSEDLGGADAVRRFYERTGVRHLAIHLDPRGALARAVGARGLPTSLLIDREGREIGRLEGAADWDSPEAVALIRYYLGAPAGS